MLRNFVELETILLRRKLKPLRLVLVNAHEEASLCALADVVQRGYIEPTLIGHKEEIEKILDDHKIRNDYTIIDTKADQEAAFEAVSLVRQNRADILMKGFIQTSDLLREVVHRDTGIRNQSVLSHVALVELPYLDRMIMISDGGMIPYPRYEQRLGIVENAIRVSQQIGISAPKVALLDAAEHINTHIPVSLESEKISSLDWGDAVVEGPISLDLAMSERMAQTKKYRGKIQGDADIFIVPDIISGNILGKVGTLITDGRMAGIIEGARVPIVLTSRGSSADEKIHSILLACLIQSEA